MVQNTCSSVLGLENDHVFYFAINPLSSFTSTREALLLIQLTTISYCQDMRFGLHPPNLSQMGSNSPYPRTVEKSFVLSYAICKLSLRQSDRSGSLHTPSSLRDRSFSTSSWWNNIVSVLQLTIQLSQATILVSLTFRILELYTSNHRIRLPTISVSMAITVVL